MRWVLRFPVIVRKGQVVRSPNSIPESSPDQSTVLKGKTTNLHGMKIDVKALRLDH